MKTRIKKLFIGFAGFLIGAGLVLNAPLVSAHSHKHHHKHHHKHNYKQKYSYYYYPAQQIYYSPVKRGYYYLDRGAWVFNAAPPAAIQLGNRVQIELGNPVPYLEHPYVIQQHPVILVK